MSSDKEVRVRFAPAPTGPLHIGSARTALFNWLFARANGGKFVLRIEDTDEERSEEKYEEDIKKGLEWLGLDWDEFYKQSQRKNVYREYLEKLLEDNRAYYCFCTTKELEEQKQLMLAQGMAPKYSGKCRTISGDEARGRVESGESSVIRLKIPDDKLSFMDMIRGKISFDGALMGDMIIAKGIDRPLYNLAVVIDDALGGVTHVIRGEDLISSTPKQILIMEALGFDVPRFAHLPIILNPDRSKMSKRFVNAALSDYINDGYVKDALINLLALMGWHPKKDREVLSVKELVKEFDLGRVQKGGAGFDQAKLDWLNNHYLKEMKATNLKTLAENFVPNDWKLNAAILNSVKGRLTKLSELEELVRFYFELPDYETNMLKWKDMNFGEVELNLNKARGTLGEMESKDFKQKKLEEKFLGEIVGESRGEMLWPLRVALSGLEKSPSPFEIMEGLGKKESLARVDLAILKLQPKETYKP